MQSAPPIVSQAYNLRTRFLSLSIFFTEYAKDNVTASGKPSGIATTTTVIPMMKNYNTSAQCFPSHLSSSILSTAKRMRRTIIIKIAETNPKFPISIAIDSNFPYNGVASASFVCKSFDIFPKQE